MRAIETSRLDALALSLRRVPDALLATLVVLTVGMMIVPLPTPLLDVLIAANLAVGVLMVLVAMYVPDGLAFTAMPTILLMTTLYRLALNVSTTRLILLQADAGEIIEAFGGFVVQGSYAVGAVVFLLLTIVQYVVVARGSERVAEVGARFALDAMPGKQMAIDAEQRAGDLTPEQAQSGRRELHRESQFYGAMDGAMKFVKGDVIAGLAIISVNVVGGVLVGMLAHDLSFVRSLRTFGLLTIGDGLVSQIPSLLVATSAGLVVTRVASDHEDASLGADVGRQLFGQPRLLGVGAGFLALLATLRGLPAFPFAALAVVLGLAAYVSSRRSGIRLTARTATEKARDGGDSPLRIELAPWLADTLAGRGLDTLQREALPAVRSVLMERLGVEPPDIEVRASDALGEDDYGIYLHEMPLARASLSTRDPDIRHHAGVRASETGHDPQKAAHQLADALLAAVLQHPADLLGVQETQQLLRATRAEAPALVQHVVPRPISLSLLTETLRRLLEERVSVRPMREILEALAQCEPTRDAQRLADRARRRLARRIVHTYASQGILRAHAVDPEVEEALREASPSSTDGTSALPPALAPDEAEALLAAARALREPSRDLVLLTRSDVRRRLFDVLASELSDVHVLAYAELPADLQLDLGEPLRP